MARINYTIAGLVGLLAGETYLLLVSVRFDFATYYKAAQALSRGGDPYVDLNYRQLPLWAWLLQPLAQLPFSWASPLWLGLSVAALVAGAALTFAAFGWPLDRVRLLWLLAFLACPPTLICLFFGQATPFVLLGYSGALFLARNGRYALAGLALAAAMIKPHLTLVAAPLLLALPFTAWAGFAVGAALWLVLSAVLGGPALVSIFFARILSLSASPLLEERPTIFGLIGDYLPQPMLVNLLLAAALVALLAWLCIARLFGRPFPLRPRAMTVICVLLLPYVLVNDLVLLLPVYLATMAAGPLSWRWLVASLALIWTLPFVTMYLGARGIASSLDGLILVALLLAMRWRRKQTGQPESGRSLAALA